MSGRYALLSWGACVVCSIDDECGTAHVCINERCVYEPPANCIRYRLQRITTLRARRRRRIRCSPGVCPGNLMNGEQLVARTYTGLVLCDGAENRYTYDAPAGEGAPQRSATPPTRATSLSSCWMAKRRLDGPMASTALRRSPFYHQPMLAP